MYILLFMLFAVTFQIQIKIIDQIGVLNGQQNDRTTVRLYVNKTICTIYRKIRWKELYD